MNLRQQFLNLTLILRDESQHMTLAMILNAFLKLNYFQAGDSYKNDSYKKKIFWMKTPIASYLNLVASYEHYLTA